MALDRRRAPSIAAAVMLVSVLVLGVSVEAGPDFSQCKKNEWRRHGFRNQGECVSLLAKGGQIWNLTDDFRTGSAARNPNPDRLNTNLVWYFGSVSVGQPPSAELYTNYTVFSDNFEGWNSGVEPLLVPLVAILIDPRAIVVHPGTDRLTVVGWQSPVTGVVRARGSFAHSGSQCDGADGIAWSIDTSAATLASGTLDVGQRGAFAVSTFVTAGDVLYFSVGPRANFNCDSTFLDLTIVGPVAGQ
jgi:hypothetical protein